MTADSMTTDSMTTGFNAEGTGTAFATIIALAGLSLVLAVSP